MFSQDLAKCISYYKSTKLRAFTRIKPYTQSLGPKLTLQKAIFRIIETWQLERWEWFKSEDQEVPHTSHDA